MKVSVIGLGKLGSPLAALLASKGHDVLGIDFSKQIVDEINEGTAPFEEAQLQDLLDQYASKIRATTEYTAEISQTDVTFIIVPTPSEGNGQFTNRYILKAIEQMGPFLKDKKGYHQVVITSTVMPGSTGGEIQKALEKATGRKVGEQLGLCYNPEFIALGSVVRDMLKPDMILIGESDQKAGDFLQSIYEGFCENTPPFRRMNFVNAELTKISLNTYVTTKISYANMLGAVCDALPESDVDVVTQAIGCDSRIGTKYLNSAVAFGGPCFPRDNVAFRAMANDLDADVAIAEATQRINDLQTDRLEAIVNKHGAGKRIGILGLSYKPGTNVVEESPGIKIANRLAKNGFQVTVYDPLALEAAEKHLDASVAKADSLESTLSQCEVGIIMTNWPEFSSKITAETLGACQTIIDCWRCLKEQDFKNICEIVHLGKGAKAQQLQTVS